MKFEEDVLVCYNIDHTLNNESIDTINEFNLMMNPEWEGLEYGSTYRDMREMGSPYNGRFRYLDSKSVWILPFPSLMKFPKKVNGVYDIFTKVDFLNFEKTLDPLPVIII